MKKKIWKLVFFFKYGNKCLKIKNYIISKFITFENIIFCIFEIIPKVAGAVMMGDFRPIALANFQFKIVTILLADRLAVVAMRIISLQQRGFVRDKQISDCVIIASEAINLLDKKQYGGNIALKVDIWKSFNTLDWKFLISVLRSFGFAPLFCDWIIAILHSKLIVIQFVTPMMTD